MDLNDLLHKEGISPRDVLILRHSPREPGLAKVLPWLAADRPYVFNAYQQTQGETVQNVMKKMIGSGYVASSSPASLTKQYSSASTRSPAQSP